MITTTIRRVTPLLLSCALVLPATADEIDLAKAADVADRAISKAVAWRPTSGENILEKEIKYKGTQPYTTAEGLLVATRAVNVDQDRVKRGLDLLNAQATKSAKDPAAEFYKGEVLKWLDQSDQARTAWRAAEIRAAAIVAANPDDARAQYYLGAASNRLKKADTARKALKKAVEGGFDPAMSHFQIAVSYVIQENWQQALESFNQVEKADPRFAHLYFYRGLTWDKLGRKDKLLNDLDQFVKLAPNAPEAKTARAVLDSVK